MRGATVLSQAEIVLDDRFGDGQVVALDRVVVSEAAGIDRYSPEKAYVS